MTRWLQALKALFRNKMVIGGIVMVVFYQVAFISVFMSGYSALPSNLTELKVAIVNEDAQAGAQITDQLLDSLPFETAQMTSLEKAREELDARDIHMIIHIPADFSAKVGSQDGQATLDFILNQSNPAMASSTMQSLTTQITDQLNAQFAVQTTAGLLEQNNVPSEEAEALAQTIPAKVAANVETMHAQPAGMHNQMAPMFLAMVSFVSAMIFSMIVTNAVLQMSGTLGKWRAFTAGQGINILVSLIAPLIGLTIYFCIQSYDAATFVQMWLFQSLAMYASILFCTICNLLFGQMGMLFNMLFMLMSTIANGAVMPQQVMHGFYRAFSYITVMFYSVRGNMDILFGGSDMGFAISGLAILAILSLVIITAVYSSKVNNRAAAAAPVPAEG